VRCVVSYQAKSKPREVGTPVAVLFVCWPASSGTIVAKPILRRGARVASIQFVGSSSSNHCVILGKTGGGKNESSIDGGR
jgi:hypothetical protein